MGPSSQSARGTGSTRPDVLISVRPHPAGSTEPTPPADVRPAEPPGAETGGRGRHVPARTRWGASVLLLCYLLLVVWLALRPLSMLWVSPANLEPLATIRADLARGPEEASRTLAAGLLRLAPLGVLLPLVGARLGGGRLLSLARTVFAGTMVSLGLECGQTLAPSRVCDVDSVLLNTLGVALTHQLCYGLLRRFALPRAPSSGVPRAGRAAVPPPVPAAGSRRRAGHRAAPGARPGHPAGPPVARPHHHPTERRSPSGHRSTANPPLEPAG